MTIIQYFYLCNTKYIEYFILQIQLDIHVITSFHLTCYLWHDSAVYTGCLKRKRDWCCHFKTKQARNLFLVSFWRSSLLLLIDIKMSSQISTWNCKTSPHFPCWLKNTEKLRMSLRTLRAFEPNSDIFNMFSQSVSFCIFSISWCPQLISPPSF